MKNALKSLFTKNIGWKIVSLFLGLIIWAVISNTQDPVSTKTVSVPVTYMNEEALLSKEKLVFMSGPDSVQITVKARSSNLSKATSALFTCSADLMDHSGGDLSNQRVHVSVTQISGNDVVLDWNYLRNDPNISVTMDEQISKTFEVQLFPMDSLTEGLILEGSVTFDPKTVTVTGPQTKFGSIASVKAAVDMKSLSDEGGGNITRAVELKLYDANNKLVSNTGDKIKMDPTVAMMSATIDRLQNVNVIVSGTVGTPAEGYRYLSSGVSPSSVTVQGLMKNVTDFTELYIPAEVIDITNLAGAKDYQIDLSAFLPEGVVFTGDDTIATVHIETEPWKEKSFYIPADQVKLIGQQEGLTYKLKETRYKVNVLGFVDDLNIFDTGKLESVIDVTDLTVGGSQVPITVSNVNGFKIENADTLSAFVTVKEAEEENSSGEESSENESEEPEGSSTEKTSEAPTAEHKSSESEENTTSSESSTEHTTRESSSEPETTVPEGSTKA